MANDEEMAALKERWEREEREPTPLPWRVVRYDEERGGPHYAETERKVEILGSNENTVADNERYYPHAIKAADAEFIVQRVNAHDALVAALEAASPLVHKLDARRNQIDAALALARGGE